MLIEKEEELIMKTKVIMEKVDMEKRTGGSEELCKGEIAGARPVHHIIEKGKSITFAKDAGYYHILILIKGSAEFIYGSDKYAFDKRTVFIPAPDKDVTAVAKSDAEILEIQWDIAKGDDELIKEYKTEFPVVQKYLDSIQYVDPNKSEKTISRMMVPQRIIPRFSMGSVESYGYDLVKPHSHPMLDQFFYSFAENDMDVLINGEPIRMTGDIILHIPLGADHGVEVTEGKHMHYMWIDFLPDNELGLKRLDERHKVTGTMRSFDTEK